MRIDGDFNRQVYMGISHSQLVTGEHIKSNSPVQNIISDEVQRREDSNKPQITPVEEIRPPMLRRLVDYLDFEQNLMKKIDRVSFFMAVTNKEHIVKSDNELNEALEKFTEKNKRKKNETDTVEQNHTYSGRLKNNDLSRKEILKENLSSLSNLYYSYRKTIDRLIEVDKKTKIESRREKEVEHNRDLIQKSNLRVSRKKENEKYNESIVDKNKYEESKEKNKIFESKIKESENKKKSIEKDLENETIDFKNEDIKKLEFLIKKKKDLEDNEFRLEKIQSYIDQSQFKEALKEVELINKTVSYNEDIKKLFEKELYFNYSEKGMKTSAYEYDSNFSSYI